MFSKKILIGLLTIAILFGVQGASALCTPHPVLVYITYAANSSYPPSLTSATLTDTTNSQSIAYPAHGVYVPSSGLLQMDLGDFSTCANTGDALTMSIDAGSGFTGTTTGTVASSAPTTLTPATVDLALVCGNNVKQTGEECDGTDATSCPGVCYPAGHASECTCPTTLYGLSISPSSIAQNIEPGNNGTEVLTITNTGAYNLSGVNLTANVMAGGNITFTFNATNFALTSGFPSGSGQSATVLATIVVTNSTVSGQTFTGQVNATGSGNARATASVSITTSAASELVRRTHKMNVNAAGLDGANICLGEPVVITATSTSTGDPIERADVDVYLNSKKVFYGPTDKSGQMKFTPVQEGEYTINVEKARFKENEITITVASCGPATTTTTTSITVPETTTVVIESTTSVPQTTTILEITTTVAATTVPTTTVVVPTTTVPPAAGGLPWGTIIVVVVILVIVAGVVLYMGKQKKGGEGEASSLEKAKKPKAGEKSAE